MADSAGGMGDTATGRLKRPFLFPVTVFSERHGAVKVIRRQVMCGEGPQTAAAQGTSACATRRQHSNGYTVLLMNARIAAAPYGTAQPS
jgi:hypothetical protein